MFEFLFRWLGSNSNILIAPTITFLFGLTALVVGALYNAYLARKRDDLLREKEAKAVAAGLYGEMLQLRIAIADVANIVSSIYIQKGTQTYSVMKFDSTFLERVTVSAPIIYPALASKLGLLPADLVLAVTQFHANCESVRSWIPRMVEREGRPFSYNVLSILHPAKDAVLGIKPTLKRIEDWLGFVEAAQDPVMTKTLDVISMEEDMLAEDVRARSVEF